MELDGETLRKYCAKLIEVNGLWQDRCAFLDAQRGRVLVRMDVTAEECNMYGNAFGGYLMSATDLVGSAAAASLGKYVVTQASDVHFIRPVPEGTVVDVVGSVYHEGRTSCIVEVRIMRRGADSDNESAVFLFSTMTMHYVGDVAADDPLLVQAAAEATI